MPIACRRPAVRTIFTSSRRPAGPLAPPPRRLAFAPAPAANRARRLARSPRSEGPPEDQTLTTPPGRAPGSRDLLPPRHCPGRPGPVKGAYGVPSGKPLTELGRQSRRSQLSGAGIMAARTVTRLTLKCQLRIAHSACSSN
jgi:hypothetical protein